MVHFSCSPLLHVCAPQRGVEMRFYIIIMRTSYIATSNSTTFYVLPPPLLRPHGRPRRLGRANTLHASLSSPIPSAPFSFPPPPVYLHNLPLSDTRPELVGTLLWTVALYFGFSPPLRYGDILQRKLSNLLSGAPFLSEDAADSIATSLHTLPFLAFGLLIDAEIRHVGEGSAVWAVATGLSAAAYAGLGQLATSDNGASEDKSDIELRRAFERFAEARLMEGGMCHLMDIKTAIRRAEWSGKEGSKLYNVSDGHLRRLVRARFPRARRSPNGFYRGLSVVHLRQGRRESKKK